MKKNTTYHVVVSGLFIAMGLILPSLFHAVSLSGSIFLPIHIPVLLCGLICGWKYGLAVGISIPLLSSILTGMPPIYPYAISMVFELGTYGLVIGMVSKKYNTIIALLISMISGRIVMGIANVFLLGFSDNGYSFTAFITGSFITALPGILIQIILIPIIIAVLKKSRVITL
ncbi:MAG: ECF transporter S component [Oscillospiraceae bacterium]